MSRRRPEDEDQAHALGQAHADALDADEARGEPLPSPRAPEARESKRAHRVHARPVVPPIRRPVPHPCPTGAG
jgi:hypothetical protein